MIAVWVNKSEWRKPGPIVSIGLLNAYSFAKVGIETHFFISEGDPSASSDDIADFYGLEVEGLSLEIHRIAKGSKLAELPGRLIYRNAIRFIKEQLAKDEEVLLLTRELGFIPAALKLRKKNPKLRVIYESHDFFAQLDHIEKPSATDRRKQVLERTFLPKLDLLLCITEQQERLYNEALPKVKTLAAPLGCGGCRNISPSPQEDLPKRRAQRALAYVGHLHSSKGSNQLGALAKTVAELDLQLVVLGGHQKQVARLEEKFALKNVSERLTIHPFLPPTQMHQILAEKVSVGLCPLQDTFYNSQLTCPVKALDYLSHGIPTVASDLADVRSLLADGALYVEPGKQEEMLSTAQRLLDDPALYEKISTAARARATELSWENRAKRILQTVPFESLVGDLVT